MSLKAPVRAGSDEPTVAEIPSKDVLLEYPLSGAEDRFERHAEGDPIHDEAAGVAWPVNFEEVYNLKGRLLTIVDATFSDPEQRKAFKDILWVALRGWANDQAHRCGDESSVVAP